MGYAAIQADSFGGDVLRVLLLMLLSDHDAFQEFLLDALQSQQQQLAFDGISMVYFGALVLTFVLLPLTRLLLLFSLSLVVLVHLQMGYIKGWSLLICC